ncbi:MAG: factor-independent urate hydroxylase, partial [Limisphaerales bacterium]
KNTVNALAQKHLGDQIELFGRALGEHFLNDYPQIRQARIQLREHSWQRMEINGAQHPHSFLGNLGANFFARIVGSREKFSVESGVEDLLILKTTESGFEGYPKDKFTTLPETKERILATNLNATWRYQNAPENYSLSNQKILAAMLKVFATTYSPSVQATLFQMAEGALQSAPEISQIHLVMPNKHCLLVNLSPFGLENKNEIFVPTDEPHGQIEATISRDKV